MIDLSGLRTLLMEAPEGQLDESMKPLIAKWDETPTSIQILEVLDKSIYYATASDFVVRTFQIMLDMALESEKKTLEDITPLATWRNV